MVLAFVANYKIVHICVCAYGQGYRGGRLTQENISEKAIIARAVLRFVVSP